MNLVLPLLPQTHMHTETDIKSKYQIRLIGISWIELFLRCKLLDIFTGYCAKKDLSTNSQQVVGAVTCLKLNLTIDWLFIILKKLKNWLNEFCLHFEFQYVGTW